MTREIGSIFTDGDKTIQVVSMGDDYTCEGCVYEDGCINKDDPCEAHKDIRGECTASNRSDGEDTIFKLIKEDKHEIRR